MTIPKNSQKIPILYIALRGQKPFLINYYCFLKYFRSESLPRVATCLRPQVQAVKVSNFGGHRICLRLLPLPPHLETRFYQETRQTRLIWPPFHHSLQVQASIQVGKIYICFVHKVSEPCFHKLTADVSSG